MSITALSACRGDDRPAAPAPPKFVVADVILSVSNMSARKMHVSLRAGQGAHRLGTVPAHAARSFSLPSDLGPVRDLAFQASDRSRSIRSSSFQFTPGQRILWTFDDKGSGAVVSR
ncbi:MAG: hypothetical protein ABIR59_08205 [Gemmatimonadales bacterium]